MSSDREKHIDKLSNEPLDERARQEVRYVLNSLLNNGTELESLSDTQKKTRELWAVWGWLVQTIQNRVALAAAGGLAIWFGGEDLINSVVRLLGGFLQ